MANVWYLDRSVLGILRQIHLLLLLKGGRGGYTYSLQLLTLLHKFSRFDHAVAQKWPFTNCS